MPEFVRAAKLDQIPQQGFLPVEVNGQRLLIGRANGKLFACLDRCPHEATPLRTGCLTANALRCDRHGWTFDVHTAQSLPEPSAFVLATYQLTITDGYVLVRL